MGIVLDLFLMLLLNSLAVNANPTQKAISQHTAIKERLFEIRNQLPNDELKEDIDLEIKRLPIPIDIKHFHPQLNNQVRAISMAWLGEPAEEYGLSYHSYFLSISIFDSFLQANALKNKPVSVALRKIQLAAISALKIAANINQEADMDYARTAPQPRPDFSPDKEPDSKYRPAKNGTYLSLFSNKHCNDLCGECYTSNHVDRMTRYMMRILDYTFALTPTVDFWVYQYLGLIGISHHEYREDFIRFFKLSMHALSIAVLDADSRLYAPIELAFATVQVLIPTTHRPIAVAPECLAFMKHYVELSSANPIKPRIYEQGKSSAEFDFGDNVEWMWFRYQELYNQFVEDMKP